MARECEARYPSVWTRYLADPRATPPGGEPTAALVARVMAALRDLAGRGSPALVVMHGRALRIFVSEVLGTARGPAPAVAFDRRISNGAGWRVTHGDGRFVEPVWIEGT